MTLMTLLMTLMTLLMTLMTVLLARTAAGLPGQQAGQETGGGRETQPGEPQRGPGHPAGGHGGGGCLVISSAALNTLYFELETNAIRRFGLVSIVSYSRSSLMIIASAPQFHVYLLWGQRPFSIVS